MLVRADAHGFVTSVRRQADWLLAINPAALPGMLRSVLTAELVAAMLASFATAAGAGPGRAAAVVRLLVAVTKADRFDMTVRPGPPHRCTRVHKALDPRTPRR